MNKKSFVVSTIIFIIMIFFIAKGTALASQTITFNVTSNNTTAVPTVPENKTPVVTNTTPVVTNTTGVPQTGEHDTYIIAGVGAFAVVIGLTAFALSKKNN